MKNFKLILKSFFSNNATVEGARHRPWYFAVIIFFFSMVLAILPIFVQNISKRGSDAFKQNRYNMDNLTLNFSETISNEDINLTIIDDETSKTHLLIEDGKWNSKFKDNQYDFGEQPYYFYSHKNENSVEDFRAFYLGDMSSTTLSEFVKAIENDWPSDTPLPSLLIMTQKQIVIYVCNPYSKGVLSTIVGDYQSSKIGWNFKNLLAEKSGTEPADIAKYHEDTWKNWTVFCDEIYNNNRLTGTWTTTLIMLGIDVAIVFFMGLMVFILTRGKNNPFRIYTFWESMKIAFWAANAPAVLTCGLGFLLTNFVQVLFALLIGVRVMWLTMKTLGPNNVPAPSPSYKQVKTVDARPSKK